MDSAKLQQIEREAYLAQANRDQLRDLISRAVREDGSIEPLKGLTLHRVSSPRAPLYSVYDPVILCDCPGQQRALSQQ